MISWDDPPPRAPVVCQDFWTTKQLWADLEAGNSLAVGETMRLGRSGGFVLEVPNGQFAKLHPKHRRFHECQACVDSLQGSHGKSQFARMPVSAETFIASWFHRHFERERSDFGILSSHNILGPQTFTMAMSSQIGGPESRAVDQHGMRRSGRNAELSWHRLAGRPRSPWVANDPPFRAHVSKNPTTGSFRSGFASFASFQIL